MAKSVLDIIIRTIKEGGADKETVKGLVAVKKSIMDAAAVGASLVAAGYAIKTAFDATVGTMVAYADQVRNVQRATQLSAEEASRLIQYTDDMGVSYETLEKAIKSAADTTDFSIEGLARASDAYLKITDANERAAYAQKLYGKAWVDMVGVLEKGGAAIRDGADAISGSLVLTQQAVDQAREYEIAVDNLSDTWQGFVVEMGGSALPLVNDLLLSTTNIVEQTDSWTDALLLWMDPGRQIGTLVGGMIAAHKELNPQIDSATTSYTAWAKALEEGVEPTSAMNAALKETALNYGDILRMAESVSKAEMTYRDEVAAVTADTSLSVDERKAKLDEIEAKYSETTAQIVSDSLIQKMSIDGLTQAEFEKAIKFQESTGLISKTAADQALAFNQIAQAAADGKLTVEQMQTALNMLQDKNVTLTVTEIINRVSMNGGVINSSSTATGDHISGIAGTGAGFSGYRAGGGDVGAGQAYVVGEDGPEVFIPNQNGTVIPNGGGGSLAGGNVYISLTIASPMTILDEQAAKKTLLPLIVEGVREAKARGAIS